MRGATDGDLTAFYQIDARCPRFDANITAAAQKSFRLSVNYLDAHRATDGDSLTIDDSNSVVRGLIGARCGRCGEQSANEECGGKKRNASPQDFTRVEEKPHAIMLRSHPQKVSPILYVAAFAAASKDHDCT
jgi:hypothetical protein